MYPSKVGVKVRLIVKVKLMASIRGKREFIGEIVAECEFAESLSVKVRSRVKVTDLVT